MLTKADFEKQIADESSEYRADYDVAQTAPQCSMSLALVAIRPTMSDTVSEIWRSFSEPVQRFVRLCEDEEADEDEKTVQILQSGDRCYAGYANIYRAIQELSPYLTDARFFIDEADSDWVDEYRICDGHLSFCRVFAPEAEGDDYVLEGSEWMMVRLLQLAHAKAGDVRVAIVRSFTPAAQSVLDAIHTIDDTDHTEEAQNLLNTAVALDAESPFVQLQLGRLHRLRGEVTEAVKCFSRARQSDESKISSSALKFLASTALEAEDHDSLLALSEELEALEDPEALLLLANVYYDSDKKRAMRYLQHLVKIRERWDTASCAVLTSPFSLHSYEQLLKHIDTVDSAREHKAELMMRIASGLLQHLLRDTMYFKLADALLECSLKYDSTNAVAWYQRGLLTRRHSRREKPRAFAFEYFAKAAELQEHREALKELAEHAVLKKQYVRAQDFYSRYLAASEKAEGKGYGFNLYMWHALFAFAECMLDHIDEPKGDVFQLSLAYTRSAIESYAPWFEPVENTFVLLGDMLAFQGRLAEATTLYDWALESDSQCVQAISHKASVCCNQNKYEEAEALLDSVEAVEPNYWHLHYVRSCVLSRQEGAIDMILTHLKKTMATIPENCREIVANERDLAFARRDARYQALMSTV